MAVSPAPEGSAAARFAEMLRQLMQAGTRPAGRRGTGAWSVQAFAVAIGVSERTVNNYRNGGTLPPDISRILDAFFADDPRHATARAAFLAAFDAARGVEAPARAATISNISIRVPIHFMGRDEPLAAIHAALQRYEGRVAITALHGLRGVGKTVLAAAYADRQRDAYRATWWIRAQTEPTMRADLVGLAVRLGWVAADEKEEPALATALERLRQDGDGILLIYDNAITARDLAPYLPRGGAARIIVTSNARAWRGIAEPVEIRLWPKSIGADFLLARTGRAGERAAAEALSEALGGLPLAHEMAAAYCEHLHLSLAEYTRRFAAAPARMLDDHRRAPAEYHDGLTVAKTFGLAIAEAARMHPAAEPLIQHAALLAAEPIPLFLFQDGREKLGEPLATLLADDGLEEAVAALLALALIDREAISDERDPEIVTDTIRLHRLVREIAATGMGDAGMDATRRALLAALVAAHPGEQVFNTPTTWPRAQRLDALALGLVGNDDARFPGAEAQAATLLNLLAVYRHGHLAAYAGARPLYERALAIREKMLGPEHPDTAPSLNNLAFLLQAQGDLAGARPLYERALAIREKMLGPEHPLTATSLNNLARLLQALGDLAGARPLYERALAIREKLVGPEHPHTALNLNNLAFLLQAQGDLAGARPLYERALAIREKMLGPEHPDTAASLNGLAGLLQAQGDLAGARPLYERALAIREKMLGPEHPDTAASLNNLAFLLQAQGDLAGARPLNERALAIYEKMLGPEHPETATSLNNLAFLLQAQGDLAGARPLFERALTIKEKALGPDHSETALSLNNLARLLRLQGDLAEARKQCERALTIQEKALGPDHPLTGRVCQNFAQVLLDSGEPATAANFGERALAIHAAKNGDAHAWTLDSARVTADAWDRLGRQDEAASLRQRYGIG